MRATWIILAITVVIGAGMYFFMQRKPAPSHHDTIAFVNRPDSIIIEWCDTGYHEQILFKYYPVDSLC
jgi:hypothetical protein